MKKFLLVIIILAFRFELKSQQIYSDSLSIIRNCTKSTARYREKDGRSYDVFVDPSGIAFTIRRTEPGRFRKELLPKMEK
jgi:hypothetical protein